MKIKEAVGIDVGKLTNEARVHTPASADMLSVRCKPLQAQQSWHLATGLHNRSCA